MKSKLLFFVTLSLLVLALLVIAGLSMPAPDAQAAVKDGSQVTAIQGAPGRIQAQETVTHYNFLPLVLKNYPPTATPVPTATPDPVCYAGQVIEDAAGDVSIAHIDVISAPVEAQAAQWIAVTFNLLDLPDHLYFNRDGVPDNYKEYEWTIAVDVDDNLNTGGTSSYYRGADYLLSAMHFVPPGGSLQYLTVPDGTDTSVWEYDSAMGSWKYKDAGVSSVSAGQLKLTGHIPGLSTASRVWFITFDYNPGGVSQRDLSICHPPPFRGYTLDAEGGYGGVVFHRDAQGGIVYWNIRRWEPGEGVMQAK